MKRIGTIQWVFALASWVVIGQGIWLPAAGAADGRQLGDSLRTTIEDSIKNVDPEQKEAVDEMALQIDAQADVLMQEEKAAKWPLGWTRVFQDVRLDLTYYETGSRMDWERRGYIPARETASDALSENLHRLSWYLDFAYLMPGIGDPDEVGGFAHLLAANAVADELDQGLRDKLNAEMGQDASVKYDIAKINVLGKMKTLSFAQQTMTWWQGEQQDKTLDALLQDVDLSQFAQMLALPPKTPIEEAIVEANDLVFQQISLLDRTLRQWSMTDGIVDRSPIKRFEAFEERMRELTQGDEVLKLILELALPNTFVAALTRSKRVPQLKALELYRLATHPKAVELAQHQVDFAKQLDRIRQQRTQPFLQAHFGEQIRRANWTIQLSSTESRSQYP